MPPKGSVLDGDVQQGLVDRGAAGNGAAQHFVTPLGIGAEIVERERARAAIDVIQRVVEMAIGLDRQHRTEDLVAHHRQIVAGIDDQRRRQLALAGVEHLLRRVELDHAHAFGARLLNVLRDAAVMPVVDDAGVVGIGAERRIELAPPPGRRA